MDKNPRDVRSAFYLAQTHECLGNHKEAIEGYKYRATLPGWDEENYMTYYRLGKMYEIVGDWNSAEAAYLKGYSLRPTRIEVLIKIIEHYWSIGNQITAFMFAHQAARQPVTNDVLFVEQNMYDYSRWNLLGMTAWYVGEFQLGYDAVLKALEVSPNETHLHNNLKLYKERLKIA